MVMVPSLVGNVFYFMDLGDDDANAAADDPDGRGRGK